MVIKELKHYINGNWVREDNTKTMKIINPATQEVIANAPVASREETIHAIKSAKKSYESGIWSTLSPQERSVTLIQIADKLEEHLDELVNLEVENNGKTKREAFYDAQDAIETFRYYAGLLQVTQDEVHEGPEQVQTMIVKEPIGVTGLIVPWNFPLLMSVWKIAPALAAGNSIILKPAEITPMTAVRVFEIMAETDLPSGVATLIMGEGAVVGDEIAKSCEVDMVSFTGSTNVGKTIMQNATTNMKKVSLELGGKSPSIIFNDADVDVAIDYTLYGIFLGAGQVCSSGSRLLVQEDLYETFVDKYVERAKKIRTGPGIDEAHEMGAIVSEAHMESILKYIQIGKEEGATLRLGGNRLIENGLEKGFFIEPTIFTDVTSDMRIVQEEIFGPVVTIQKFKDEAEAIALANDTAYGLAGAVFSTDHHKAIRVIKKVRAGITWVNTYHLTDNQSPWGGYKQSGIGRSLGTYGLNEYQEVKQINIKLDKELSQWFENE